MASLAASCEKGAGGKELAGNPEVAPEVDHVAALWLAISNTSVVTVLDTFEFLRLLFFPSSLVWTLMLPR